MPLALHGQLLGERAQTLALSMAEGDCDFMLVALKRNIVEATFIAVRWQRGEAAPDDLAYEMLMPLDRARNLVEARFFDDERVDGALQRARLAAVLRFYFERAERYGLFDRSTRSSFLDHLARLERTGLDFRASQEGYIVTRATHALQPFSVADAHFTVLGPAELEQGTVLSRPVGPSGRPSDQQPQLNLVGPMSESLQPGLPDAHRLPPSESTGETPGDFSSDQEDGQASGQSTGLDDLLTPAPTPKVDAVQEPAGPINKSRVQSPASPLTTSVLLGHALAGETPVVWEPSIKGSPHLFVLGIPGQGKSWTVARAVGELAQREVPSLILDFHGQFTANDGPLAGARQSTVLDARDGLPFSPLEVSSRESDIIDWQSNAFAVAEIFGYVCKLGDMQRDVVFTAVRDAYRAAGFGREVETSGDAPGLPSLRDVLARIERQERQGRSTNVAARCRPLLEMDLFRPPDQPASDLRSLIRGGLVIDLHRLADLEVLQLAAGAFLLRKLYKDMFSWGEADRIRLAVVLDEAHRLSRDVTLPKIMKEGRKFGILVVAASQGLADFHADVLNNTGTRVIFRLNHPESRRAAGFIRAPQGVNLAERIEQLSVGQAYVQTPEMRLGSVVTMAAPSQSRTGTVTISQAAQRSPIVAPPSITDSYKPGDFIDGQFEVIERLGSGGFSRVYRVRWAMDAIEYALKLFRRSDSAEAVQRELKALRLVSHPRIVKVVWAGQTSNGEWYIVSELLMGETLEAYTTGEKQFSPTDAVKAISELLEGLEAIHPDSERIEELEARAKAGDIDEAEYDELRALKESGLVHRDIKPQNLFLTGRGVVLINFGIVSRVGDRVVTFRGTPSYQSPDIFPGTEAWDVSPDLFAAGIVLYQLVCHEHPFENGEPRLDSEPRDPSYFQPDLPPQLAKFLVKACAPHRQDRFATAREMRAALQAIGLSL